ncbi:MAG: hypothetical protein IJ787_02180 [Bacilli bacterium]|nr:hypothetical protein [Bacilli bacterium]
MEYIKLRLDFKYAEKGRFYRVFLVPKGIGLYELGCHLVNALKGTHEHSFLYRCGKVEFVPAGFMEDPIDSWLWMGQYTIDDLKDTFEFEYDTGDGWDFRCKKYKKPVIREDDKDGLDPRIIFLEGAGQGIWEDNIGSLYGYFNGEIGPKCDPKDEENGFYAPWNVAIENWSDFDLPLDPEEEVNLEDYSFGDAYQEETELAVDLGLDQIKRKEDPCNPHSIDSFHERTRVFLANVFALAYGYEDIPNKMEDFYGRKQGETRYVSAFFDSLSSRLSEDEIHKMFEEIKDKLDLE